MYYKLSIIVLTNTKVRHKNVNKKRVTNLNLYYPFKGVERESYFKFHFFFLLFAHLNLKNVSFSQFVYVEKVLGRLIRQKTFLNLITE